MASGSGGWSSLPADLLSEVSGRLSSSDDLLHIHQVCTHWRSSTPPLSALLPWVLAGRAKGSEPIGDYSLRLPRGGAHRIHPDGGAPPAGLPYCCGANCGWLALVDDHNSPTRLMLWEPLSNAQIPLPCPSRVRWVFLSDDPLTSSNWAAVTINALVWRPGDAAWTSMLQCGYNIETITFHQGKAYCIDSDANTITICDLSISGSDDVPPKCSRIFNVRSIVNEHFWCDRLRPECRLLPVCSIHPVASNGDLLLVVLRSRNYPSWAQVYKPDWAAAIDSRWSSTCRYRHQVELGERVTDLGDYSLFLGRRGHAFAVSAREFPAIKRNCVYYADKPYYKTHWISVLHLESNDDVGERVPYPEGLKRELHGEAKWRPYAWFCPRTPFFKQQAGA